MILTRKQMEGLHVAIDRYKQGEKYTIISGYAGSGKSTLVKFIISELEDFGIDPEVDVVYATFTGKAAQVLSQKGNKNVSTLHKLLFKSFPQPNGTFRRVAIPVTQKIVVVDEISMAPKSLIDQLFKNRCYVIGLGDPFQLPPVFKNEDNHLLDHPHVFLDEIMRQAKESEIIQLTMDIRNHNSIKSNSLGKEVHIHSQKELSIGMLTWADQILVATNKKRIEINNLLRQYFGKDSPYPQEGDKLICCRNYWEIFDEQDNNLINGTIGYIKNPYQTHIYLPRWVGGKTIDITGGDFVSEIGTSFDSQDLDTHMIITGDRCVDKETEYKLRKNKRTQNLLPLEFAYGYAITCHKAQGSQWDKVLVLEENFPFDKEEHARWLYTACTRAVNKLVLVR